MHLKGSQQPWAGRQAGRQEGKQASQQAGRKASRQASRQAGKQAGRQASRQQAGRQLGKQASRQVGRQESEQLEGIYLEEEESEPCPVGACRRVSQGWPSGNNNRIPTGCPKKRGISV